MTEDEFYDAHVCPACGYWCDEDDCECPDTCFPRTALAHSRAFPVGNTVDR